MGISNAMRRLIGKFDLTVFVVDCILFCAAVSLLGELWQWLSAAPT